MTLSLNAAGQASLPWPHYEQDELDAVMDVLKSGRPNQWGGTRVDEFAAAFAEFVGCRHGVALANGTLALDACLKALGIGPGDEVIATPRSFVASASSIAWAGARPVFADVDPDSQNVTAVSVAKVVTSRTRAVLAVHLSGNPCDMEAITALAREKGLKVIEDCAQAHGARWNGKPVGSWGDVAAWSFCQDKHISTGGEGGMVTTNDDALYEAVWSMKDHGRNRHKTLAKADRPGFRWLADSFGTNWRMTEMQAAIGVRQLGKLPAWLKARRRNAALFMEAFAGCPAVRVPVLSDRAESAYYRFYAFVRPENLRKDWDRDRVVAEAGERGLFCQQGGCAEIYREKAFVDAFGEREPLPVAKALGETSLCFQVHHNLSAADVKAAAEGMREILNAAAR